MGFVPPAAAQSATAIERAVRTCVDEIHHFPVTEPWQSEYFWHFQARYDPATRRTEHNAWRRGDRPVLIQFAKCMKGEGFLVKPAE